jgi:hypothetical protein
LHRGSTRLSHFWVTRVTTCPGIHMMHGVPRSAMKQSMQRLDLRESSSGGSIAQLLAS